MIDIAPIQLVAFWSKVKKSKNCWIWIAYKDKDGYGKFSIHIKGTRKSIPYSAYRISYELFKGEIPEGLQIDHLCRNRACVNPEHLDVVTCKENLHRSSITLATIFANKTHCPKGHPYSHKNLYGEKVCRTCHNESSRRYFHKKIKGALN